MKGYRSVSETAKKWGISIRWVNQYILEGRVPGCERLGRSWAVPEDAVKPERQKSGVKKRESNRHWAGKGCIQIDSRAVDAYLSLIGETALPKALYKVVEIEDRFPIERVNQLLNPKVKC